MEILSIHILLGIILFIIINWIGKHSYSIGYIEISIFVKDDEAPAFNFLIRVFTPIIFIIIISSVLYHYKLDQYVKNIFLVNVYYIMFRLGFNLITNRMLLINWYRQTIQWMAIISISYFVYEKIIKVKSNVLPDFNNISNEMWIVILIFLYQVLNNIRFSRESSEKRKKNYLKTRFLFFSKKYDKIINEIIIDNLFLSNVIYSIIIYEDFNRPKVVRLSERIWFRLKNKKMTLGVMQVKTDKLIDDLTSVKIGVLKISESFNSYLIENNIKSIHDDTASKWHIIRHIAGNYNQSYEYQEEISNLFEIIELINTKQS